MFNNVALDIFIGLVFIFLLYSLLATIIQEMIATRLAFRAKVLEKAILRMLDDAQTDNHRPFGDRIDGFLHILGIKNLLKKGNVAPWFYAHPLIKYLGEDNYYSKPAYLHATNFSKVMIDLLKDFNLPESQAQQSIHNSIMRGIIHKLPINIADIKSDKLNPAVKILRNQNMVSSGPDQKAIVTGPAALAAQTVSLNINTAFFLKSLWQDSGADLNTFRAKLEDWFNDTMDRATGWYKKYTRLVLLIIGLIVAYVFNVDSIAIHRILATNKPATDQLVQMAIANKNNLDPDKFESGNDSILKATYQMVAKNANDANNILGLGKPWKDSCNMYRDSLKSKSYLVRFDSLTKIHTAVTDSFKAVSSRLSDYNYNLIALLKLNDSTQNVADKIAKLKSSIAADSINMEAYETYSLPEYYRMEEFKTRYEFISQQRAHTWFLFSPNQTGGWETLLGWIITALAITLGAPFWFDMLSKLVSLRGAGTLPTPGDDNRSNKENTVAPQINPKNLTVDPNPGGAAA